MSGEVPRSGGRRGGKGRPGVPRVEHGTELGGGQRPAEQVALGQSAAHGPQLGPGAGGGAAIDPAAPIKEFGTMWTFDAPPLAYWKARYGFTPDQAWLDRVRQAAFRIPGCSSSIVSPDGLLITENNVVKQTQDATVWGRA